MWKSKPCDKMVETNISMCPSTSRPGNSEVVEVDNEYLKGLLSKIAELQKVVGAISEGTVVIPEGAAIKKCVDEKFQSERPGSNLGERSEQAGDVEQVSET